MVSQEQHDDLRQRLTALLIEFAPASDKNRATAKLETLLLEQLAIIDEAGLEGHTLEEIRESFRALSLQYEERGDTINELQSQVEGLQLQLEALQQQPPAPAPPIPGAPAAGADDPARAGTGGDQHGEGTEGERAREGKQEAGAEAASADGSKPVEQPPAAGN